MGSFKIVGAKVLNSGYSHQTMFGNCIFCVLTENLLPTTILLLLLGLLLSLESTNKDQLYVQGSVNSFVQVAIDLQVEFKS